MRLGKNSRIMPKILICYRILCALKLVKICIIRDKGIIILPYKISNSLFHPQINIFAVHQKERTNHVWSV